MDNTSRCALLAKQSGLSYGYWMSLQKPKAPKPKVLAENEYRCLNCGVVCVRTTKKASLRYCGPDCGQQYRYAVKKGYVKDGEFYGKNKKNRNG